MRADNKRLQQLLNIAIATIGNDRLGYLAKRWVGNSFIPDENPINLTPQQQRWIERHPVARLVINDDMELARHTKADGLHLPACRLAELDERPDFEWVGASCHNRAELEKAAALGLDYAVLGNVKPTLSHPERAPLGWEAFSEMISKLPLPVFALGGLAANNITDAKTAGAHGIAAIRSIWQG